MANRPNSGQGSGYYRTNPDFKYPDKSIRFLDGQRGMDISKSGDGPSKMFSGRGFRIQRGYIRNMQPASLTNVSISRCYFQFNPQEIRQQVRMREDIYNPIMLTPEQLSQPIGGNVSFQFDLLFDRSRELSSNSGGPLSSSIDENLSSNDPTNKAASKIGVYADLQVLYNIIGQGLSSDTINLQIDMLRNTYNAKVARDQQYSEPKSTDDTKTTDGTTAPIDTTDAFTRDFTDQDLLRNLFGSEGNKGNAAFLMPNPVRIVFSPLIMVDGFVTDTSVDFLKFNNDMIPMQCRVGLAVNALYIGFAKQRTFLSETISVGVKTLEEERTVDTALFAPVEAALLTNAAMRPFRMGFGVVDLFANNGSINTDWKVALNNGTIPNCSLYYYLMPNAYINNNLVLNDSYVARVGFTGFPNIRPNAASGKDIDPILTLFENPNNNKFTISYDWGFKIYGKPGQNDTNGVGWSSSEASQILNSAAYETNSALVALVGNYYASESASDKDGWGSGTTGDGDKRDRIRRRTYKDNDELSNYCSYELIFDSATRRNNIKNSYYVVVYTFSITLSAGSVTKTYTFTNPKDYVMVVRGDGKTGVSSKSPSNVTSIEKYSKLN